MDKMKQTKLCYIATLDILGMSNAILSDTSDEHLNHIWNIYQSWIKISKNSFNNLKVKVFSDNIAVVVDVGSLNAINEILDFVAYMQDHFLNCGYKIRGAVTKGQVFIDDMMIWGDGLVNAYNLESKKAIFPRVIIDTCLIDDIPKKYMDDVIMYRDDYYCTDFLKWYGKNHKGYLKTISRAYEILDKEKDISDGKIKEKNKWLAEYLEYAKSFHEKQ